jgi:thioester reductase-like protein
MGRKLKILITGGNGFLGHSLIKKLILLTPIIKKVGVFCFIQKLILSLSYESKQKRFGMVLTEHPEKGRER